MDILREQSDATLSLTDNHMCTARYGCDRNDAFVADDIMPDAPCVNDYAAPIFDDVRDANESGPETYRQPQAPSPFIPVGAAASPVGRLVFAAPPRPVQGRNQRAHQSSPGAQRQMGGVRQTNRFFIRRQFA